MGCWCEGKVIRWFGSYKVDAARRGEESNKVNENAIGIKFTSKSASFQTSRRAVGGNFFFRVYEFMLEDVGLQVDNWMPVSMGCRKKRTFIGTLGTETDSCNLSLNSN